MRWTRSARLRNRKFWRSKLTRTNNLFSSSGGKGNVASQTKLVASEQSMHTPRHIAITMDGNGRCATKRHLPRLAGHKQGVSALRRAVECAGDEDSEIL